MIKKRKKLGLSKKVVTVKPLLKINPKYYPPQYQKSLLLKKSNLAFFKRKKFTKIEAKFKKIKKFEFKAKQLQSKKSFKRLLKIFIKKNPYVLIRKNYKYLFKNFFKEKLITPLLLDYLHLAYFKLNINTIYRPRLLSRLDSYAKKLYRYTLSKFKTIRLSNVQYFFVLMKKKTHFQKVLDFYDTKNLYTRQLHQLEFFQKVKKLEFKKFLEPPKYLHPEAPYIDIFKNDYIRYNEYIYMQQILEFYYPVTEIHFKETHIHGKPMKTKLPRRV